MELVGEFLGNQLHDGASLCQDWDQDTVLDGPREKICGQVGVVNLAIATARSLRRAVDAGRLSLLLTVIGEEIEFTFVEAAEVGAQSVIRVVLRFHGELVELERASHLFYLLFDVC